MQNVPFRFKFSQLPGDLVYALAGVHKAWQRYRKLAVIDLGLNIAWGMDTPIAEGRKSKFTISHETFKMLRPLILSQPYISDVRSWEQSHPEEYFAWGDFLKTPKSQQDILKWYKTNLTDVIDLDKQHLIPVNIPLGNIARWNFYTYPDLACDLSQPWLYIPLNDTMPADTIIINRTARYTNTSISYTFLKPLESRMMFAGTEEEYITFCATNHLDIPLLKVADFWELAVAIKSCSFFIGNQSFCFALAEAMKVPRILELSREMPNVIPCGEKAYDFYFQSCLETYVNELK